MLFDLRGKINKVISKRYGYSFTLRNICLSLTYQCNLRCPICGFWGEGGICQKSNLKDALTLSDLKNFIEDVSSYRPNILLSGGEPLLHNRWYELSKYIKGKGLYLELQTNGIPLEKEAERVVETIDRVNLSLDGPENIHNQIRGSKEAFDKAVRGIRKINKIKEDKRLRGPDLNISFTISDLNYQYLEETVEVLKDLGVGIKGINFLHLMFMQREVLKAWEEEVRGQFFPSKVFWGFVRRPSFIDGEELAREIIRIKRGRFRYNLEVTFLPDFTKEQIRRYYDSSFSSSSFFPECFSPYQEGFLMPDGEFFSCPVNVLGNIKFERFKDFWNGKKARDFRKRLAREAPFPICRNCRFKF